MADGQLTFEKSDGGTFDSEMSILVLGGTGFIGKHLVQSLLETGEAVKIFSRGRSTNPVWLESLDAGLIELITGDLSTFSKWDQVLEDVSTVFHVTGSATPELSDKDPAFDIESNLLGTVRFLQHAIHYPDLRILFCSSGGTVYGLSGAEPIAENAPTNPVCAYGVVKLAIEKYLEFFRYRSNLNYIVLRPSNLYGPWQDPSTGQGIVGIFFKRILEGRPIQIFGDGANVRDYLFVDDLVDALLKAATYRGDERIFNIGSGQGQSINELVHAIEQITQKKAEVSYLPQRTFDVRNNVLDIERARDLLGWEPKTSFSDGLAKTYEWLIQNCYSVDALKSC